MEQDRARGNGRACRAKGRQSEAASTEYRVPGLDYDYAVRDRAGADGRLTVRAEHNHDICWREGDGGGEETADGRREYHYQAHCGAQAGTGPGADAKRLLRQTDGPQMGRDGPGMGGGLRFAWENWGRTGRMGMAGGGWRLERRGDGWGMFGVLVKLCGAGSGRRIVLAHTREEKVPSRGRVLCATGWALGTRCARRCVPGSMAEMERGGRCRGVMRAEDATRQERTIRRQQRAARAAACSEDSRAQAEVAAGRREDARLGRAAGRAGGNGPGGMTSKGLMRLSTGIILRRDGGGRSGLGVLACARAGHRGEQALLPENIYRAQISPALCVRQIRGRRE